MDSFVFEFDVVSQNRRADEVYIDELRACDVYLNPKVADPLYQVKYIEKFGAGFTDLVNDCRAAGLPDPIVDDSGEFTITIFRQRGHGDNHGDNHGDKVGLTEPQKLVLQIFGEDATISIRNIAERMGLRRRTIETHIAALKKRGMIVRVGGTRDYWRVVKGVP